MQSLLSILHDVYGALLIGGVQSVPAVTTFADNAKNWFA